MVQGYRCARAADEANAESLSGGGWSARDDGNEKITFKKWLKSNKGRGEVA